MAMFPPSIPHVFIRWLTEPGDVVYDPFSGRGTTALEALLEGRKGYGSDLNPLALVLSGAKVAPPSLEDALARLSDLEVRRDVWDARAEPETVRPPADGRVPLLVRQDQHLGSRPRFQRRGRG
jgi:hypothetical protein